MPLLAQAEIAIPMSLLRDLGNLGWVVILVVLWFMSRNMVTKADLVTAMADMREQLRGWAETRFQTKAMCNANHRYGNGERASDSD